jgi:O-antigen ligase
LEIWLKIGLLGLAAYFLFLGRLIAGARRLGAKTGNNLWFGASAGLIFLAITNVFTPYLNHPLGIGVLLLSSCLIYADRVYYQ